MNVPPVETHMRRKVKIRRTTNKNSKFLTTIKIILKTSSELVLTIAKEAFRKLEGSGGMFLEDRSESLLLKKNNTPSLVWRNMTGISVLLAL